MPRLGESEISGLCHLDSTRSGPHYFRGHSSIHEIGIVARGTDLLNTTGGFDLRMTVDRMSGEAGRRANSESSAH